MIKKGDKVFIGVKDGRKSISKMNGTIVYITKHIVGVDTGKYIESFNVADIMAQETSLLRIRFKNAKGKYVRGYIRKYPFKIGSIELEKCIQ